MTECKTAGEQCIRYRTAAGLECICYPKREFGTKTAALAVKAGGSTLCYTANGRKRELPMGTAHFVEHMAYHKPWGDAFTTFAKQGAYANAFTDGAKTVYYFSCRKHFASNLELLLSFLQDSVFTPQDTQAEKAVIEKEIQMYEDDANWKTYFQMLRGLYPADGAGAPIAGSEASVREIETEHLYRLYWDFYVPQNAVLIVGGDISAQRIFQMAEKLEGCGEKPERIRTFTQEDEHVEQAEVLQMGLRLPVFHMGFRHVAAEAPSLMRQLSMEFAWDILAGISSDFYAEALQNGWLQDTLSYGFVQAEGYAYSFLRGQGVQYEKVSELLLRHLERLQKNGVQEAEFERIRKKRIGQVLRSLGSVNGCVMGQAELSLMGADLTEAFRLCKSMRREMVERVLQNEFTADKMVLSAAR